MKSLFLYPLSAFPDDHFLCCTSLLVAILCPDYFICRDCELGALLFVYIILFYFHCFQQYKAVPLIPQRLAHVDVDVDVDALTSSRYALTRLTRSCLASPSPSPPRLCDAPGMIPLFSSSHIF